MVNYADDRDEIFVHGTKRLLSANASVRQLTRSCWPSGVRSQRRFRGHALATQVSFPGGFVVRDFAMTCSNRFSDIDLTVGKLFHRRHTPGKQKFRTFLYARQRAVEFGWTRRRVAGRRCNRELASCFHLILGFGRSHIELSRLRECQAPLVKACALGCSMRSAVVRSTTQRAAWHGLAR